MSQFAENDARLLADLRTLADEFRERSDDASRRELADRNAYARRVVWDTAEARTRAVIARHERRHSARTDR
jgi:hypothetical protein